MNTPLHRFASTTLVGIIFAMPLFAHSESKNCLWRVEGAKTTIHLLGSVHTLTNDAYPLAHAFQAAYASATTVVFEIDIREMEAGALSMLNRGTLKDGKKLNEVVSKDTWAEVVKRLDAAGLGVKGFDTMKPWFLAMTLLNFELTKAGYSSNNGIDFHFHNRAVNDNKEIVGLESFEYQIALFDNMDQQLSEDFLRYTLKDFDDIIPMIENITTAWKKGDIEKLALLLNDDFFDQYPKLFASIVTERNNAWAKRIETMAKGNENTLVIVGTLHLVGPNGIVEQLRRKGFQVTQF